MAFSAVCAQCGAQLRIVDNLQPTVDPAKYFRCSVNDAVVAEGGERLVAVPGHEEPFASLDVLSRMERLMVLASVQSEKDHPVCPRCLQAILNDVQKLGDSVEADKRRYQEAHRRLEDEIRQSLCSQELRRLEDEVHNQECEEQELLATLAEYDREEAELRKEMATQALREVAISKEEKDLWLRFSECQLDFEESEEDQAAITNAMQQASEQLHRLKRTNTLNQMFHISQDGSFGTINGFRLGRLPPDHQVQWEEINAALGLACLLLDCMTKKCQVPASQYRLQPKGSFSAIQAGGETLLLYSNDSSGLTRFFDDSQRFDLAMVAFLSCLGELARFLLKDGSRPQLPFKIEGDKVGNFSVRLHNNQDEKWTKALKYMLCDLKWSIAIAESKFG